MKKYFKIPKTPEGFPHINGQPYSFVACMTYIIDHDPRFNEKISDSRKGSHLIEAFDALFEVDVEGAQWCEAEEDALKLLSHVLEEPKCGWHDPGLIIFTDEGKPAVDITTGRARTMSIPTRHFLVYADAPASATYTDPRKAAKEQQATGSAE